VTIEREVYGDCWSCPFVEKHDWSNDDDSGTEIERCDLGHPAQIPAHEARKQLGAWDGPPEWCKLRSSDVVVKLKLKPRG